MAILGAGFTGLWTAYYLLAREPSLKVVVLEAEIAGFGASGRNGAWCSSGFPVSPGELQRRFGREAARELLTEMRDAVEEVGRVARAEEIDAQYFRGGQLASPVARASYQVCRKRTNRCTGLAWRTESGCSTRMRRQGASGSPAPGARCSIRMAQPSTPRGSRAGLPGRRAARR